MDLPSFLGSQVSKFLQHVNVFGHVQVNQQVTHGPVLPGEETGAQPTKGLPIALQLITTVSSDSYINQIAS